MDKNFESGFFALSNMDSRPKDYLLGYAFTSDALVRGEDGLGRYKVEHGALIGHVEGGRFLCIENVGDETVFHVDPSGQDNLFLYRNEEIWIIGNSLLKVAEKMKHLGVRRTPCLEAISVFRTGNQSLHGGQIVSSRTPLSGVTLVNRGDYVRVSWEHGNPRLAVMRLNRSKPDCYSEALQKYVSDSIRRSIALVGSGTVQLSLSGGIDSRACLGLLKNGIINFTHINALSNKSRTEEFEVAKRVSESQGVELQKPIKGGSAITKNSAISVRLPLLANAGIYAALDPVSALSFNRPIRFHGGSTIGSGYMRATFSERSSRLVKKYGEDGERASEEIRRGLCENDVDIDSPTAMMHHYRAFRARLHYGRNSLTLASSDYWMPFLDEELAGITGLVSKEYVQGNGVTRDIIRMTNPELLNFPFSEEPKVTVPEAPLLPLRKNSITPMALYGAGVTSVSYDVSEQREANFYDEVKEVLMSNVDLLTTLGFSQNYIDSAVVELHGRGRMVKSAILYGLGQLFS